MSQHDNYPFAVVKRGTPATRHRALPGETLSELVARVWGPARILGAHVNNAPTVLDHYHAMIVSGLHARANENVLADVRVEWENPR